MTVVFLLVAGVLVALGGLLAAADSALGSLSRADIAELATTSRAKRSLAAISEDVGAHANATNFMRIVAETTAAVLVSAGRVAADDLVATQGHVLTVADLLSTLTVEAAVHHLDLVAHLDRPGPAAGPLAEVRRVLEELLGQRLPPGWDDVTAARRGTGRQSLTEADRAVLGAAADRFPLFG